MATISNVSMERGTGATTQQIRDCPTDTVYICVNSTHADYCRRIAEELGRRDIRFATPNSWLSLVRGTRRQVVVDHAAVVSPDNFKEIFISNQITSMYRDATA